MPAASPILTIPTSPICLDADVYVSASGASTNSFVGTTIAENDRWHHSNLRRALTLPFPLAAPPRVCELAGIVVAEWPWMLAPQTQTVDWFVKADVPAGAELWAVGYVLGMNSRQPFRGFDPGSSSVVAILGGAGGVQDIGPISVDVRGLQGSVTIGLAMMANQDAGGTTNNGLVATYSRDQIVAVGSGAFAGWAGALPPCASICLTDGVAGAGSPQISPWYDVVGISSSASPGTVNNVAHLSPQMHEADWIGHLTPGNNLGYYIVTQFYADLYSLELRERPLSGSLASVV